MKRTIIALTTLAGLFAQPVFAENSDPKPSALQAFQKDFRTATNVVWEQKADLQKVHFNLSASHVEAYYTFQGELIGTARTVLIEQLPLSALTEVYRRFAHSPIYDVTEYSMQGDLFYILTVEQGFKKLTVKVYPSGDLTVEKKSKSCQ